MKLQITDYLLKPVDYEEEFGACIDHLRIALFEKGAARAGGAIGEGEKTIWRPHARISRVFSLSEGDQPQSAGRRVPPEPAACIGQAFQKQRSVLNYLSYLTNIRMERAKELLVSTDLPVSEVAQRSGYAESYRVFTKAFKKTEGVTPSQYR